MGLGNETARYIPTRGIFLGVFFEFFEFFFDVCQGRSALFVVV